MNAIAQITRPPLLATLSSADLWTRLQALDCQEHRLMDAQDTAPLLSGRYAAVAIELSECRASQSALETELRALYEAGFSGVSVWSLAERLG